LPIKLFLSSPLASLCQKVKFFLSRSVERGKVLANEKYCEKTISRETCSGIRRQSRNRFAVSLHTKTEKKKAARERDLDQMVVGELKKLKIPSENFRISSLERGKSEHGRD